MTVWRLSLFAGLLAMALVGARPASAHARLVRVDPSDRAVLSESPRDVHLYFDDRIRPLPGNRAIRNDGGSVLAGRPFQPAGARREVVIPLRTPLPHGAYTVKWRVLSDDGHLQEGVLAFAVGLGSPRPVPALSANGSSLTAGDVLARWFFFVGLLTAVGAAAFIVLVMRPTLRRLSMEADPAGVLILMCCGLVVAFLGAAGLAAYHHHSGVTRASLAFSAGAMLSSLGVAAGAIRLSDRSLPLLPLPFAFGLVAIPAFAGHAFDRSQPRWWSAVVDMAHVSAAAVWLGGLLTLAVAVPRVARTVPRETRSGFSRELVERFSTVALVSVAVVASSGFVRAVFELDRVGQVWSSAYGRTLLVKTALLVVLLGVARQTRHRLVPRTSLPATSEVAPQLRRSIRIEIGLLVGVLIAVAVLTELPPGRDLGPPSPAADASQG